MNLFLLKMFEILITIICTISIQNWLYLDILIFKTCSTNHSIIFPPCNFSSVTWCKDFFGIDIYIYMHLWMAFLFCILLILHPVTSVNLIQVLSTDMMTWSSSMRSLISTSSLFFCRSVNNLVIIHLLVIFFQLLWWFLLSVCMHGTWKYTLM